MTSLPNLRPGAASQFQRGNSTGCLFLHGFMASPSEVGWAGDYLHKTYGYTVFVPRLAGHGVDPAHMNRMRWQDWYAQAQDSYHILQAQCERVIVIGHSMGGLLALLLAATQPVAGVVSVATPITAPSSRMRRARLLSWFKPYNQNPPSDALQTAIHAEQTRRGDPKIGRVHYVAWATRAVYELYLLMEIMPEYLPQITAPLLLLTADHDGTVVKGDEQFIAQHVKSTHIEQCSVTQGGHIMFQDVGREEAFRLLGEFIQRL
jgi:carboxylesterase